jgi:hypothetical protein
MGGQSCSACGTGNTCSQGACCINLGALSMAGGQGAYQTGVNFVDDFYGTNPYTVVQYGASVPPATSSVSFSTSTNATNCDPCTVVFTNCNSTSSGTTCDTDTLFPQTGMMFLTTTTNSPDAGTFAGSTSGLRLVEFDSTGASPIPGGKCAVWSGTHNFSGSWP